MGNVALELAHFMKKMLPHQQQQLDENYIQNHRDDLCASVQHTLVNILIEKLEKASIAYGRISDMEQLKNHPQNNFLEIETKNGKVKVLGPGAIHDNFIPEVNKMPELDEHGKKIRAEFSSL